MDYAGLVDDIDLAREKLQEAHASGFVVGLSGGIDRPSSPLCAKGSLQQYWPSGCPATVWKKTMRLHRWQAQALRLEWMTIDLSPVYDALLGALPKDRTWPVQISNPAYA